MKTKVCFRCFEEKDLSEFYRHPQNSGGYSNKCKSCAKRDSRKNYEKKSIDEYWVEAERLRGRDKYNRLDYREKYLHHNIKYSFRKSSIFKNLNRDLRRLCLISPNEEAHHWNYNQPLHVIIMDKSCHKKIHKCMKLDNDSMCYIGDGDVLDTADKHIAFISNIIPEHRIVKL